MPSQWNAISNSIVEVELTDGSNNVAIASGLVPSGTYGIVTYIANPSSTIIQNSGTVIANQGLPSTIASGWPIIITGSDPNNIIDQIGYRTFFDWLSSKNLNGINVYSAGEQIAGTNFNSVGMAIGGNAAGTFRVPSLSSNFFGNFLLGDNEYSLNTNAIPVIYNSGNFGYTPLAYGRQPMSSSIPVTMASDQTIAVSGTLNTTPSSGDTSIVYSTQSSSTYLEQSFNFNNIGDNIIISGTINQTIRLYSLVLVSSGITNLTFKPGNLNITGPLPLYAGASMILDLRPAPWWTTAISSGFIINSSTASNIAGIAYYTQS